MARTNSTSPKSPPVSTELTLDASRYHAFGDVPDAFALTRVAADGKLTPTETRVLEQALEKALLMRVEKELAVAGQVFLDEVDRHTHTRFAATQAHFRETLDRDRPDEDQHILEAMHRAITELSMNHFLGTNRLGAVRIAEVMERPVSTEIPDGLWMRLLTVLGR
jgi:hypothetical protein